MNEVTPNYGNHHLCFHSFKYHFSSNWVQNYNATTHCFCVFGIIFEKIISVLVIDVKLIILRVIEVFDGVRVFYVDKNTKREMTIQA